MKTTFPRRKRIRGFTLIELLVVIAIIALLATMGVAGGQIVIKRARELQAKTAMKGLEIAIKGYKTEYLRLPSAESSAVTEDNAGGYDTGDSTGMGLIDVLMATDTTKNPRQIHFYDPPPAKNGAAGYSETTGLRDPWGQGYKVIMDYGNDGRVDNPYAGAVSGESDELITDVIIYCAGSNKMFEEGGSSGGKLDDLRSWQ